MNKAFIFTVELQGEGATEEEAWQDAIDSFFSDPGEPCDVQEETIASLYTDEVEIDTESIEFDD
jgi:hypothetical protein